MRISGIGNSLSFPHKIVFDIGASSPRGTIKYRVFSDEDGSDIYNKDSANAYLNDVNSGFDGSSGFIERINNYVKHIHSRVLQDNAAGLLDKSLSEEDKKLSGVTVLVPGPIKDDHTVAFLPNLFDKNGKRLRDIDFSKIRESFEAKGIEYVEQTANTNDEVVAAAASLVASGVDAVFAGTDWPRFWDKCR